MMLAAGDTPRSLPSLLRRRGNDALTLCMLLDWAGERRQRVAMLETCGRAGHAVGGPRDNRRLAQAINLPRWRAWGLLSKGLSNDLRSSPSRRVKSSRPISKWQGRSPWRPARAWGPYIASTMRGSAKSPPGR
jgi:hypothetical protein